MRPRPLHRRLAWAAGCVAVAWAATGFLHPVMSWTAPRPVVREAPVVALPLAGLVEPGPALARVGVDQARLVRLTVRDGYPLWLALPADGGAPVALDGRTGGFVPGGAERLAVAIARHYAGLPDTEVARVAPVTAFSTDYPSVNRLLPVYAVTFDTPDRLTVTVDPALDRLASVTNTPRRVMLGVFQHVHTLKFLEPWEPVRVALILGLIATVLATAGAGAVMLVRARGRGMRAWHVWLAGAGLVPVVAFTVSGLFHLVVTTPLRAAAPLPTPPVLDTARLVLPTGLAGASGDGAVTGLVATGDGQGGAVWRLERGAVATYPGGPDSDATRSRVLAGATADAAVTPVTRFDAEYGFINKRLPVLRVAMPQGPVFVDVREGLVAGRAADGALEAAEDWSFSTLHKFEFLTPLGRPVRDGASMLAAALVALVALTGLVLRTRRRGARAPDGRAGRAGP